MPLFTRDLPQGGRHIAPAPAATPAASATTRMRQLLPVGLLVAAASAGAAVAPVISEATSADGSHSDTAPATSTVEAHAASSSVAQPVASGAEVSPASYVLPHHAKHHAKHHATHRAAILSEPLPMTVTGKHRANGSSAAGKSTGSDVPTKAASAGSGSAAPTGSPAKTGSTTTTGSPAKGEGTPQTSAPVGATASPTSSPTPASGTGGVAAPTSSSTTSGNLVTGVLGLVGGVGGVVNGLLGGGSE